MPSVLKTTLLGAGLLVGVAATASAQSVSALPPADSAAQTARTQPYGSTQSFYPKPGGSSVWTEESAKKPEGYDTDKANRPYSAAMGPRPGSHSSGTDTPYQPTGKEAEPGQRPYTAGGMGPRAN